MEILYPIARIIVWYETLMNRIRAMFAEDRRILDAPYSKQPILLLALFEKGVLRDDIKNLLHCAKAYGAYTLCVNTAKFDDPFSYSSLIDCYIERFNHGRDFGSYRAGFLHIYGNKWDQLCPRILMLNDSVFYTSRGLSEFLSSMYETDMEVLGATENHEIEHHLGSFCLSLSQSSLSSDTLKSYWMNYRNTDYRPAVIKYGEMGLTRTLKETVSSPEKIGALYSTLAYMHAIANDRELLRKSVELARRSERVRWPRFDIKSFVIDLLQRNGVQSGADVDIKAKDLYARDGSPRLHLTGDYDSMVVTLGEWFKVSRSRLEELIKEPLIDVLVGIFNQGSQIHQNAAVLVYMGLPIVKLDGVYRGLFSIRDVNQIADLLSESDSLRLKRQLLSKPYGGDVLFGWKLAAFLRWLI